MVTLDCATSRHDGVTLVTVTVRDLDTEARIRIENRLDGPVWPPRTEGQPECGWTESGFCGIVGPGPQAFGYATPAPPSDPPVELVETDPDPDPDQTESPEDLVRQLGDPSPPQDSIPADRSDADGGSQQHDTTKQHDTTERTTEEHTSNTEPTDELPEPIAEWLDEMAARVTRAEALSEAETVPEATTAVRRAEGIEGVRSLAGNDDAQQLRAVAERTRRLADRRETATVPVETLSTLA
jgi:hypothetical protein